MMLIKFGRAYCLCGNVGFPFVNPTYKIGDRTFKSQSDHTQGLNKITQLGFKKFKNFLKNQITASRIISTASCLILLIFESRSKTLITELAILVKAGTICTLITLFYFKIINFTNHFFYF